MARERKPRPHPIYVYTGNPGPVVGPQEDISRRGVLMVLDFNEAQECVGVEILDGYIPRPAKGGKKAREGRRA